MSLASSPFFGIKLRPMDPASFLADYMAQRREIEDPIISQCSMLCTPSGNNKMVEFFESSFKELLGSRFKEDVINEVAKNCMRYLVADLMKDTDVMTSGEFYTDQKFGCATCLNLFIDRTNAPLTYPIGIYYNFIYQCTVLFMDEESCGFLGASEGIEFE